jgi:hypothetical protein
MEDDLMAPVLSPLNIIGIVGLVLLLLYIAADMPRAIERRGESITLRYTRSLRWFALFSACGMPLLITVILIGNPPKEPGDEWCIAGSYALFGVLCGYLLLETVGFAVTITDKGLECRSGWRRRRFVPWEEVTGLVPSEIMKNLVLRTRNGYRFRIPSQCIPGSKYFLDAMEAHRPGLVRGTSNERMAR